MILGFDINLLIKLVIFIIALYGLILLAVGVFKGWGSSITILKYTGKFWWVILAVIVFIMVSKKLKGKKQEVNSRIEELNRIEIKTKGDKRELKRLENEKKKIEEEIETITNDYKVKLEKLKEKPSNPDEIKPGDAGRSADGMKDAWR